MNHLITLCEFFYYVHHIPTYIFERNKPVFCLPDQPDFCRPMMDLKILEKQEKDFLCYITPENSFIGYIRMEDKKLQILLGPVSTIPYTDKQLLLMFHRNFILQEYHEACKEFYLRIPLLTNIEFVDILLLFHYMVTNQKFTRDDFFEYQDKHIPDTAGRIYQRNYSDYPEDEEFSKQPNLVAQLIEQGDVKGLIHFFRSPLSAVPPVEFGENPLQYRKNLCYYAIAIFAEAAKRGGIPVLESMKILASYYHKINMAKTVEDVDITTTKAAIFFAQKIADLSIPNNTKPELLDCIRFIRKNIYNHINVSDVADYAGYSRTHITRLFKQELGFGPGSFILRIRLEEAKNLLKYTDKSISEISSSLCFANQSHFHRFFKKQFQLTPMQYRSQCKAEK